MYDVSAGESFNSRLREEATPPRAATPLPAQVSTHASVRRRRDAELFDARRAAVSTHASVRRRPCPPGRKLRPCGFNSRLREEATSNTINTVDFLKFQLTPP